MNARSKKRRRGNEMADIIRIAKAEAVAGLQKRALEITENIHGKNIQWMGYEDYVKQKNQELAVIDDTVMKICEMELQAELGYQQISGNPEVKVEK